MDNMINDNDESVAQRQPDPDAHGQAALLLAESILHTLVESSCLTRAEALVAVQTAAEVKVDVAAANHESSKTMKHSLSLLAAIEWSMSAM